MKLPNKLHLLKGIATNMALFTFLGEPDVILGNIPLYNVKMYEVSISHQILKFRAIQTQFLAKQPGGKFSVRIDATLTGPDAQIMLSVLEYLYVHTRSQMINNIDSTKLDDVVDSINRGSRKKNKRTKDSEYFDIDDYSWIRSERHDTIDMFTTDVYIDSLYIETLIYWFSSEEGNNVINVSILLRRFINPDEIEEIELVNVIDKIGINTNSKAKSTKTLAAQRKNKVRIKYKQTSKLNRFEKFIMDLAFTQTATILNSGRVAVPDFRSKGYMTYLYNNKLYDKYFYKPTKTLLTIQTPALNIENYERLEFDTNKIVYAYAISKTSSPVSVKTNKYYYKGKYHRLSTTETYWYEYDNKTFIFRPSERPEVFQYMG